MTASAVPPEPPDSLLDIIENSFERDRIRTVWRMGYDAGVDARAARRRIGTVERAVRAEIRDLGKKSAARSLGELCLVLAKAVDAQGDDGAGSTTAKLVQELRVTLGQLREVSSGGGDAEGAFGARMGSPVRDP